jgi:hypothetical protein
MAGLCAGDLAYGVVDKQAEYLDEEINGVSGQFAYRPAPGGNSVSG